MSTANALKAIEERKKKEQERKNTNSQTQKKVVTNNNTNKSSTVSSGSRETSTKTELSSKNALDTISRRRGTESGANFSSAPTSPKPNFTFSSNTPTTKFGTEAQNAYTSAKNKASTKTTITSDLTEDERKARIKEIDVELKDLNIKLTGYGRAKAYGTSKAMEESEQKVKERISELSQERKKLQRVGTFTASEMLQWEIDDAKAKKSALPTYNPTARVAPSSVDAFKENINAHSKLDKEIDRLEREKAQLYQIERLNELNAHTTAITSKKDYAQNSTYSPSIPKTDEQLKSEGYKQDAEGKWYKTWGLGYRESYTGEDSDLYTYINDESKRLSLENDIQLVSGLNTYRTMGYHTLTDEEKGAFNYLYHQDKKNGTNTAEEYLQKISPLLQQRAMELEAKTYKEISKEAPVLMSALSLGTNLQNAAMFPVKSVATAMGVYEDMPILDMYGNRTQSIRGGVSEDMPYWGSLLYNAGMSIGDMGVALAVSGGNPKVVQAVMSSSAGSSAISEAKKNGASDGKALALGLGSAAIEWATEKYSVEAILKNPKTIKGFILANTFTEATEEGASNVSNIVLDAIVSEVFGERNEIEQRIDYLVLYEGKTEEEALNIAFNEKLQNLGEDVLVGGLTGFGMSGAKASAIGVNNAITNRKDATNQPDTLEQAAIDVVANRNATETEKNQPISLISTTEDSLPTQNEAPFKTSKNARKGMSLAEQLEEQSRANEPLSVEDVKKATRFGDAGSKLVTRLANSQGITFSQAERAVKTAYLAGFTDLNTKDVSFDNKIQKAAFDAGKIDIGVQNRAKLANAQNATVYDGVFTENEYTKNWSNATKKMVSTVAKHFGMDISAVDKIIANEYTKAEAHASHQDGKMEISSTAEKLIHALVLHESGHRMEQFATAEWNELANFLYQRAERLGRRVNTGITQGMMFDAVKAEHDNAGISMSTSGYIGEIAVRELETIFSSAEEFNSFIAEIESNQQVKSAWGKFVEWLSELIEDLKTAWSQRKMTAEEKAEARKAIAELEHIKELYAKAYLATKEAVAERATTQKSDTNSSKNLEIKTKKEYNGNTSYSVKSKYNEYNTIGMQWAYDSSTQVGDLNLLYNTRTNRYVLVEATKEGVGFVEVRKGNYSQLKKDVEIYESKKQRDLDRELDSSENGQNDNARNNVDVRDRGTGKQNAGVPEGKFNSNKTADTQTTEGNLNESKSFSLKQPVEETKDLVAVHNLWEEKLLKTLKLGGLPMPSIAIVRAKEGHSNFGNISLVFRKETISPTDRRNKVYSGDAWTPTYPYIEYKVNEKERENIKKKIYALVPSDTQQDLGGLHLDSSNVESDLNRNGDMVSSYRYNYAMKYAFLVDKGESIELPTQAKPFYRYGEVSNDAVISFAHKMVNGLQTVNSLLEQHSSKLMADTELINTITSVLNEEMLSNIKGNAEAYQKFIEEPLYKPEDIDLSEVLGMLEASQRYFIANGKIDSKIDYKEAKNLIDEKVDMAEYEAWVNDLFSNIIAKEGIRNNKDLFTPSGNRRSFEALHYEHNLENVIKAMKESGSIGIGGFGGNNILGSSAVEYGSISEIKERANERMKSLPQEEYDKIREGFTDRFLELANSLPIHKTFSSTDDAANMLCEAVMKYKTKSGMANYLRNESKGWANYSDHIVDDLVELVNDIRNMPTSYFEAKPQRAVGFNEIATAIIPDNASEELKTKLTENNVQFIEYEHGNNDARLEALNSLEDVKFSLKGTNNISSKDRAELLDIIEHLKGEFEITKFPKVDQKKLAKMTKALLKEYNSHADYEQTFKAIDELYRYMANGEEGHPAVWEDVYNKAYNVAQEIVKNVLVTDDYAYQEYKSLRNYLRTTPMKFDARYDSVPASYENFNDFRKQNIGRLKFTKDGMGIDVVYQELSHLYPEFFDAEEQINSADQLATIVDVLDSIRVTEVNPFDRQIEQVSMYLANDITSRFFDIPQAKPTFADKAERRVTDARIAGAKKVEAVRQQKDAKIKKLMEAQKEKTKKQLDKLREQRDTKVKKEQEKRRTAISKMSENQKAKVLRAQIMRHASDLSKKLINPTDNQHIPQELQGVVAKLLECINLESNYTYDPESHSYKKNDEGLPTRRTQAFNELKMVYADIASSVVVDPDLIGENGLLSDVISLTDKRIADMTSSELETVWQTIRAIEASVSTSNKIFSQGKFETILEFAEALREDNTGKKDKTELKGLLGKGKKLATLDMLTPETYLHCLGGAGDSIFRMMRDAQDKHISIMKEVADFTHKTLKGVDVNLLENTIHTVKLGGEDVKLSTAQLMELYVLMKREQAVDHILIGGILPDVTKSKGMKLNTKAEPLRNLSMTEISAAISKLTEEQKKVADKLQRYVSTVLSGYGNDASMKVYNYEKFLEKNYWTIRTNKQEIISEIGKDTSVTSVANKGMAKGTKPHANTSVRIGSIFDTFSAHSSDMATYAAWLGTSEDVNRIRNFVFKENGVRTGTVKGILDTVHGTHGSEYFQKLLTDIAIGVKGTDNMNPLDKLIGSYKAASVGANLRVVIQQPTAILRAMDMIGVRYLTEGIVRPLKGWSKAKKYAPIAQWKDWGHFDINTGRQMKDVLFDNASLLEKTKQVGMWGASKADSISWGLLWNAVEAETKANHKELEVGSDAYYETVAKRFTEIVDHTQVVDGILQRSQIMRSPDGLTKMATSFMGEPTKQYNMAVSAAYDAKNLKGDAKKKAVTRLGRTALSLAVAGIINACVQSIIDAMRDDDKEKDYWEKWVVAFKGDGEETKLINSNLGDTFNPLGYVPFAKDIMSIMQGYDVKRMDAEAISKTFNAVTNMYKAVTGTGKYTIAEASAQLFAEVGRLYGLPVANVKRDIKSLVTTTAIETDSYLMQYRMEKAMLDINYSGNSKNFMDILFNAYNNDREAYEFIYNDMLESGYDAEKIQSGMETRMKKAEGVEKSSELSKRYMSPDDEKKYDSSLKKVKSSKVWKSANATQKKNAEADLYNFLTSTTDNMKKLRTEAKAYGVDETEYTLWQLAIEMADQPKGEEGSGSYDYKEKAEAINSLNLGDREIAYFFGKGLTESGKEELNDVLSEGIDVQDYANFKAATSDMKADKNANGKSIPNSKKRKVVNYLNNANLTRDEWEYFYYEIMNYKK